MLFTETWLHEHHEPPSLPGYMCLNFARPADRQAQSVHRGGLTVYVKASISQHFSVAYVYPSRCFAVLQIKAALGLDCDMFLFVCYIAPHSVPGSHLLQNGNVWEVLEERVISACQTGQVLLLGDLNARTGSSPDYPDWQLPEETALLDLPPISTPRRSQDTGIVNAAGRQLLSLCCRTGLRIANGRTAGDMGGAVTFRGPRGSSLVDYAVCCPRTMARAINFSVPSCVHSDHDALLFCLAVDPARASPVSEPKSESPKLHKMLNARMLETWRSVLQTRGEQLAALTWSAVVAADQPSQQRVEHLCGQLDQLVSSTWAEAAGAAVPSTRPPQPVWFSRHLESLRRAARAARQHGSARATSLHVEYNRDLQRARRCHKRQQQSSLVQMARNRRDLRPFWRAFKAQKRAPRVSSEAITEHMQRLLGGPSEQPVEQPELESARAARLASAPMADGADLNEPFTAAEVEGGIRALRLGACTLGLLTVQALRLAGPLLATCLAALFNLCAAAGTLPVSWAMSAITPIHKGGDEMDPNNYRGIAVGTAIAKLFATLLNRRLTAWLEDHQLRARGQGGYRSDYRTQDHLMLLRTLVEDHRQRSKPLWVCFVDLAKFFDSVDRQLLWRKLQALGVGGRLLSAVQAIYAKVPMSVKVNGSLSEPFECVMGVKQGCPLSPTLAGIYLDDFERSVDEAAGTDQPTLHGQPVPPLLWADDLLLAATTADGLQNQLDALSEFCDVWRLSVNSNKTKAIIFHRPQQKVQLSCLKYKGQELEQVTSFMYLGMRLHSSEAFLNASIPRIESAERAVLALRSRCAALKLYDPVVLCQLFDALIMPVIMYGVEVWGAQLGSPAMRKVEAVELAFLRRLLGVRTGTPSFVVRAELGRYPLLVTAAKLVCGYWNRLVRLEDERLVKQAFRRNLELRGLSSAQKEAAAPWVGQVDSFLATIHTACDLEHPCELDVKAVVDALERRHFEQDLGSKAQRYVESVGSTDRQGYTTPAVYLQMVTKWSDRKRLAQLRTGSHWLAEETGRWIGQSREQRQCQRCNCGDIDDAAHMVFRCAALAPQRLRHPELFMTAGGDLRTFLEQSPISVAAFVGDCFNACNSTD